MSTRRVNSFDAAVEPIGLADIWIRQVFSQQARPRKLHGVSVLDDLMCWVPPTLGNFVFVQGKDGQVGFWGPIDDITGLLILRVLRPYLLTKSALTIENLLASCRSVLRHALCGDGIVAVSSVELAFWDLQGKRKGLPVHRLLSGKSHSTICYASLLGVDPRDKRITRACRETIGLGFTGVKISFRRLKGRTRATDALRAVERIRRECGDILLMVDCHGQWTLSEAVAFCSGAKSLDLHWVEEPICPRSFREYSVLTRRTQIPIAAGEHAYTAYELSLLAEIGVAVLQPDVAWCGGLNEFRNILTQCEHEDRRIAPHGTGFVPAAHVLSKKSCSRRLLEFHLSMEPKRQYWFREPSFPRSGRFTPKDEPGFGNELWLKDTVSRDYRSANFQ